MEKTVWISSVIYLLGLATKWTISKTRAETTSIEKIIDVISSLPTKL